jgi:RHS repeat-associated protein
MITATDGGSNTLKYGYNTVSQLNSVTSLSGVYPSTLLSNVIYNQFDSPTTSSIGTNPLTDTREYDVRGRVRSISVDNPTATQSTTTINVSGGEQSTGGPTTSTGSVVIEGAEQSGTFCNDAGLQCHLIYDKGTVTVTVNGTNYTVNYVQTSTPSSIASALASVLNSSGVVTASASGSGTTATITITSVAKGAAADYSLSASSVSTYSEYPEYFGSFDAYSPGNSLTGGGYCSGTCDAGTVSVTLNGTTVTAHYGGTDNDNSVAASLMTALNTSSPDVSAQLTANGTGVILTSMPSGTYADFTFTANTASTAGFSTPSFSMSPTSGTMAQGAGTEIYAAGVSYEPNGDVANSNDNVNGSWVYTYDDFNRLLTAVSDTGEGCSEKYDNLGNRIAQAAYQGSCFNGTFTGSGNPFQISGLVYDQAGNVSNDGTYVYTYDSEERVSTVSTENAALIATYVYDAEGRRARKILSSTTQDGIYDLSGHVVSYFTTSGSNTSWLRGEVFAGGTHLATYANGATAFAHADWLGTERIRSTVGGGVLAGSQWTSLPFGEGADALNTSGLHFTGKERDAESGNDYFGARYYASTMGRFLSPDWSAKVYPVPYAKLDNPQTLNLYAYVGNNPMNRFDPDGHYSCDTKNHGAECGKIKDALAIVQKADSALKEGSKERGRLDAVLKFYGSENDGKGPSVQFADLSQDHAVGETQTVNGKTTITFDTKALGDYGQAGKGEEVAHEGTHGMDDHSNRGPVANPFWKFYDYEYRAYQSESYVDKGLGVRTESDGDRPVWAPGMSYGDHVQNMTRNAYSNAQADCGDQCHP